MITTICSALSTSALARQTASSRAPAACVLVPMPGIMVTRPLRHVGEADREHHDRERRLAQDGPHHAPETSRNTAIQATVAGTASQNGQPSTVSRPKPQKAPSIIRSPWAKPTVRWRR